MPQTSAAQTTSARSTEILAACKKAFADKGFDGASMQDLAKAAGMSAGNFYRYFQSKDAIIAALVETELSMIEATFARIHAAPDAAQAFIDNISAQIDAMTADNTAALWTEIEAAASRRSEIRSLFENLMNTVIQHQFRIFAKISGLSTETSARSFAAHAQFILLLLRGVAAPCPAPSSTGGSAPALKPLILRTIRDTLSDISKTKRNDT